MESNFPPTDWPDLGHLSSDEEGDGEYQGHLYWEYQEIKESGGTASYADDESGTI